MIATGSVGTTSTTDALALPTHIGWAIFFAIALSAILASIEIVREAKKPLASCMIWQSLLYVVLLAFGNVITTLLAAVPAVKTGPAYAHYHFLFAAFLGVFAFETILRNMNVTVLDKGVFTIQDWLDKAKVNAAAAAIANDVRRTALDHGNLANRLSQIEEQQLNAFLAAKMPLADGTSIVAKLEAEAYANNANPRLYKAYALVTAVDRSEILGFLSQHNK